MKIHVFFFTAVGNKYVTTYYISLFIFSFLFIRRHWQFNNLNMVPVKNIDFLLLPVVIILYTIYALLLYMFLYAHLNKEKYEYSVKFALIMRAMFIRLLYNTVSSSLIYIF
jgi:hypothetical protein